MTMKRLLSLFVSFTLVIAFAFPTAALAAQPAVEVDNHSTYGQKVVSDITIDDVDAPEVRKQLDSNAVVSTAEGETWEIPVLWIDDDLQLATEAVEARTYLPALAFYVPSDYAVEGDTYTVKLSESLTKLFGTGDIVSVYIPSTGITYILPATLRDYFDPAYARAAQRSASRAETAQAAPVPSQDSSVSLVDIYCAQTARDSFTDEDLSWFIDLVINTLQPQAANLLIEKFPAFSAAAQNGALGTQIGLYVYLNKGDKDGVIEHETVPSALACVSGDAVLVGDTYKFAYMIGINLDDLTLRDAPEGGNYVVNPNTGKFMIIRDGAQMTTFENTIVHEMLHAFMDDYNRTGMQGALNMADVVTNPDGSWKSADQKKKFMTLRFPTWFIEGSASAVENVYTFRYDDFDLLYPKQTAAKSSAESLLANYLNNERTNMNGQKMLVDISLCDSNENVDPTSDTDISRYVSGYLATMYLSELAARSTDGVGTSKILTNGGEHYYIKADNLRMGLNTILERMHNGETMDSVVKEISKGSYEDVADFESRFIKGEGEADPDGADNKTYSGDKESIEFVTDFLDYLRCFELEGENGFVANGSILFDFDQNYDTPLDQEWDGESDYYAIVEDNGYVESSVPGIEALKGGGKSLSGLDAPEASDEAVDEPASAAAKSENEPGPNEELSLDLAA